MNHPFHAYAKFCLRTKSIIPKIIDQKTVETLQTFLWMKGNELLPLTERKQITPFGW